jgi:hypothetical protein
MAGRKGPPCGWPFIVAALALATACGGSSHVAGRVTKLEGGPLAGTRVTIDALKTHQEIVTDAMGRFDFPAIAAGSYRLKAEMPGYVMETRADVPVARGATATADFVLHPACLEEGSYVDGGLAWALQAAQAVVYVRVGAPSAPDRWIVNNQCVVGIDHPATVLSILNMGPSSGDITRTIHIVKDGRTPLAAGEEYIAFLRWEPAIGRYRPIAGPIFMIPVRDGKVVWRRTDAPSIRDGDAISKAMASLFAVLHSR